MTSQRGRKGRSKADWLEAGLEALCEGSIEFVTVERLAGRLGIAKSGFYWHFKNREELLEALLDYWVDETTGIAAQNVEMLAMEPKQRLANLAEMILEYDLARFDVPMRQWALADKRAEEAVRKVNKMRSDFVETAFAQLGFKGDDLRMRTMLYVGYHTFEGSIFRDMPLERRRNLIAGRVDFLTSLEGKSPPN